MSTSTRSRACCTPGPRDSLSTSASFTCRRALASYGHNVSAEEPSARRCAAAMSKRDAQRSCTASRMARCSSLRSKRTVPSRSAQPWQREHALGEDVALDLGGAALDRVGASTQQAMCPHWIGRKGIDTEHVHGELAQGLVHRRPLDLDHRAFGTGYPVLLGASEAAISVEPYRLRIHHQLAEAAPDRSVVRQATRADQLRELAERQLDPQRRRDAKPRALEHQRSQRDVPAIAGAADDIV